MIKQTMDQWIKHKIGLKETSDLTREAIESYQLQHILQTLSTAKDQSKYYEEKLQNIDLDEIKTLKDFERIPLSSVSDLKEYGSKMICVRQNEISRIVTLETSGTTDKPKRVFYTEADQELTVDFFDFGMRLMVDDKDIVLILLPHERPGSVGDLLARGLERFGARTIRYGLVKDFKEAKELAIKEGATALVGAPSQVAKLAEQYEIPGMKTVLLSVEYVSPQARETITKSWGSNIFEHYGMTEMGLGGAVSCWTLEGYHPREADLYFEIIDPQTGEVLPDGEYGEVVFTTLTRQAMPFIRYRTGDISRWLTEPCKCGSILKRLDRVGDRGQKKGYL